MPKLDSALITLISARLAALVASALVAHVVKGADPALVEEVVSGLFVVLATFIPDRFIRRPSTSDDTSDLR